MTRLGELELEAAAQEAAGNWQHFDCFVWDRDHDLPDADQWAILYTHHRDSGLLDQSNADAIAEALKPFLDADDPDVIEEHHTHWAVGWIDGYAIRVYRDGHITDAFKAYHELSSQLADYPILDEDDYCNREYEATLENIEDAAWRLKGDYDLPDDWPGQVFSWLWDHEQRELENRDDQGGYPSEEALKRAFTALGFPRTD